MKTIRVLAIFAVGATALYGTAGAQAASTVTVGADLSLPTVFDSSCLQPSCGTITLQASAPSTADISPVNGTVKVWRVEDAVEGETLHSGYALSTVQKQAGGTWTVTGSTGAVTPPGGGVRVFSADLPIKAGEYLMLTIPEDGGIAALEGPSTEASFAPAPKVGETVASAGAAREHTIGFNADIEYALLSEPVAPVPPIALVTPSGAPAPPAAVLPAPPHRPLPRSAASRSSRARS